jgi:addiction module RelB/DinJ family antitoxin
MTIRVDRKGVKDASKVLARMGMTPRSAIDVFLAQVALKKAIPFAVTEAESDDGYLPHIPNATTLAAMAEPTRRSFRSAKALLNSLRREH